MVEKCRFLQESNCKGKLLTTYLANILKPFFPNNLGLCLHQCKIPAQKFFKEDLGMDLTVSPNFVTQECQWSFGEVRFYAILFITSQLILIANL